MDKLRTIISSSMLGVATFAVAPMVGASASHSATPRAFNLVIADNMAQQAFQPSLAPTFSRLSR